MKRFRGFKKNIDWWIWKYLLTNKDAHACQQAILSEAFNCKNSNRKR